MQLSCDLHGRERNISAVMLQINEDGYWSIVVGSGCVVAVVLSVKVYLYWFLGIYNEPVTWMDVGSRI